MPFSADAHFPSGESPGQPATRVVEVAEPSRETDGEAVSQQPVFQAAGAADHREILRACQALFRSGDVIELRSFECRRSPTSRPCVISGYFSDFEELAKAAFKLSNHARGVYATLNVVNPRLLERARNRCVEHPKATTSDSEITQRRWLMVDLDPARASGIPASNAEHESAMSLAARIADDLSSNCGWPRPIIEDSGNGAHLLYRIDLPSEDQGVVAGVLAGLDLKWSGTGAVIIDQSVSNAARLTRLAGTVNRKGDGSGVRPHRVARLIDVPDPLQVVTSEQLKSVARWAPRERSRPASRSPHVQERIELHPWLTAHGLAFARRAPWKDGEKFVLAACPWNPEHVDSSAYVVQFGSGAIAAGCHHNSCGDKNWAALRDLVEPGWRDRGARSNQSSPTASGKWSVDEEANWECPLSLSQSAELPSFPVDALPDWLRAWAIAEAEAVQVPIDLPAMLGLAVCSAAVAKKFEVEVKLGWSEPMNLFIVIALLPGNRKSAVFRDATRPIYDRENLLTRESCPEIRRVVSDRQLIDARLRAARSRAVRLAAADRESDEREVKELEDKLASLSTPRTPQLLADDVTAERLASLVFENRGRMAVMSAEGGLFDIIAGRYSDRGGPNLDVLLKGHAGDAFSVDRVGRTRESVKHPALTLAFAIQPSVVQGLAQRPSFRGRGLLARFLYVLPLSRVGRRTVDAEPVPMEVTANYVRGVTSLLTLPDRQDADGELEPASLPLTDAARAALADFERRLEPRLGAGGDLESIADWGAKLAGGAARIAGVLGLARRMPQVQGELPSSIEPVDVRAALSIADYLLAHAHAAFALMGANRNIENAEAVLNWLRRLPALSFSRRDAHQAMRLRFPRLQGLDEALRVLIEHGWIRAEDQSDRLQTGRPRSPTFEVNPRLTSSASNPPRADD